MFLDFIARLDALVPKSRVDLTRFHGVFAPHSKHRSQVTPARRGKQIRNETKTPAQHHAAMTWAQRLKRVFKIDIDTCEQCGGTILNTSRKQKLSAGLSAPSERPVLAEQRPSRYQFEIFYHEDTSLSLDDPFLTFKAQIVQWLL